ncbi:hypothetical protein WUBG_12208, partial [Wuchereria bancrofti]
SGRPALPSYLPCPPQAQMQSHIPQAPHHNMSHSRERSSKLTGLVSNKTISDFALSPFAGFVSKKERSWLIKIQQLQCQGCGNPYEDDFYYTSWKQKKMSLEKHRQGLKAENQEYVWATANLHHYHYAPPTFAGSLGKPTLSTVNYPRQLIDLSSDSPDDDDKLSVKSSTSQKKLRALLLQLENIALLIIECDDRHRILCAPSLPQEIQEELKSGVESRMETIVQTLCLNERLQAVLLINKGRQIFARTLSFANEQQQLHLLKSFFAALSTLVKKVPSNEMNESLLVPIFKTFSRFSKNALASFINDSKLDFGSDITVNLVVIIFKLYLCRSGRPALPSYLPCPPQAQMQSHIPQAPHHNMSHSRERSSKLTGLVSNKTISDFALSPFAGFVSKKERSWLIKIQQLQCQGCGNPYEDDFYYTVCFMF